jgi:CRP/FNR family transcriptional regulator, cyclic AMP receptor protein
MVVASISRFDSRGEDTQAAYAGSAQERRATHIMRPSNVADSPSRHSQRVQLLSSLEQSGMNQVVKAARWIRKERGEFIYMPGDRADTVYVLKKGRIKLSMLAESGKEIAIDLIQPGEMFGEFALVDESPRSNMAQALDDVLMWVFDKRDFVRLLESQPKLALNYIRMVGDRRRRMEKKLSDITSKDVSARICELLHELSASAPDAKDASHESLIPLMQHDVAGLIGASRQTTTSILNDLQRRNIIELGRGWIRVKRLKELQTYAGSLLVGALHVFFVLCQLSDIPFLSGLT